MGFGGSALAMAQTLRNNAKQLAKRDKYFEKDVTPLTRNYTKIVDYKKMSPEQFEKLKMKLKREEQLRIRNVGIVFILVGIILIGAVCYFLFFD